MAVWVLGGVYAMLGTLSVVELGTMLPGAGGWYVYSRRSFGDFGEFLVGWIDWIAQCSAIGVVSIIGNYLLMNLALLYVLPFSELAGSVLLRPTLPSESSL